MTTPTVTKRIGEYDRETRDFPAFVIFEDGQEEYIGSRWTKHDASLLASDYIIQWYNDNHTPERAAALIHEELAQEGRHAQAAMDQCAVWVTGECWEETGAPTQDELHEWAKEDAAPALCEQCYACPATWQIREKIGVSRICDTCYRNEFEENPDRHWSAWEADRLTASPGSK